MRMLITLSGCSLSGCEQLVRCPPHIAGKTRSCDDGCPSHSRCVRWYSTGNFWSLLCQLCDAGWAICPGVQCHKYYFTEASYQLVVLSFTWSTSLKSANPLDAFDQTICEVIGRLVPTTVLRSISGDKLQCRSSGSICDCSCWDPEGLWCCKGVTYWTHQEYSEALHLFTWVVGEA